MENENRAVSLSVNGTHYEVLLEPRVSLLDALRETLHLTGTKKGCNQGACGACTVLVNGTRINACLALAIQYQDVEIITIEGLRENHHLHPLQQALSNSMVFSVGIVLPARSVQLSGWCKSFKTTSRVRSPKTLP